MIKYYSLYYQILPPILLNITAETAKEVVP